MQSAVIAGGGGGASLGGGFGVSATIGQPSAGVQFSDAACVSGGFWPVIAPGACPGDADRSRAVNLGDIMSVLEYFGLPPAACDGQGDANADGIVNFADITAVLANFLFPCPA